MGTHVSAEFRVLNAWGVSLFVILLCSSLGHCMRPFRCITKIAGSLVWVLIFIYFLCANVYRFRDAGRACSMDDLEVNLLTPTEKERYDQGLFQRRALTAYYCLIALGII